MLADTNARVQRLFFLIHHHLNHMTMDRNLSYHLFINTLDHSPVVVVSHLADTLVDSLTSMGAAPIYIGGSNDVEELKESLRPFIPAGTTVFEIPLIKHLFDEVSQDMLN